MKIGNAIKLSKNKNIYTILLLIIAVIMFFSITGTITSGYHFADDHEIISINKDLGKMEFGEVATKWIVNDFSIRFRPLYFFVRVLKTNIFGTNLVLWSVYNAFLLCITLVFFYLSMRKLQFDIINSILFLLIVLIGQQSAIWWRLGPNETLGVTMLSISFFFASKAPTSKRKLLNNLLFSLFLVLSSLCKESFIIIIPGMIIFKVFNEKQFSKISLIDTLKRNISLLIPFITMFIELYIIIKYIGTNKVGYVGIQESASLSTILDGIFKITNSFLNLKFQIFSLALVLLFIYLCYKQKYNWKLIILPMVFCISIIFPNLILYYKYGLWERYLIPATVGIAFLLVSTIHAFKDKLRNVYLIILIATFAIYSPNIAKAFFDAKNFTYQGEKLGNLIESILDNNTKGQKILLSVEPVNFYEQSVSLKTYLKIEHNINIYGFAINDDNNDEFAKGLAKGWYSYFRDKTYKELDTVPNLIVVLDKKLSYPIFDSLRIDKERYTNLIEDNPLYANYKLKQ